MVSDSNGDNGGDAGGGRRRKSRSTTIDLPASEVRAAEAARSSEPGAEPIPDQPATDEAARASVEEGGAGVVNRPGPESERQPEPEATLPAQAEDRTETGAAPDEPTPRDSSAAPRPPARDDRRTGVVGALVAAVIGGIVVLAGGALLLAGGLIGAPPAGDEELGQRMVSLEERIGELTTRLDAPPAADPDLTARLQALEGQVGDDTAVNELAAAIQQIRTDLAGLSDTVSAGPTTADLAARIDELQSGLADLEGAVGQAGADLAPIRDSVGQLDSRLNDLAGRLQSIEERLAEGPAEGEIAALSLAVTSLSTKVSSGEPFVADLEIVRAAAPTLPAIDTLAAHAETGVPTIEALASSFPQREILATAAPTAEGDPLDRLIAGAKSLVNYRETGSDAADPTQAAVARIQEALAAGDLQEANAAAESLPEVGREAAAGWIAELEGRIAADQAVAAITDHILSRLQAPAAGQ